MRPLNVAHERLASAKVIVTFPEYCDHELTPANVGCVISIHVTVAVIYQVVPCLSTYCQIKLPLPVKVMNSLQKLLMII
ncbi:TPA: hypothetical protein DCZ39_06760 [Patescibacteria group bacterium]|nr:hypothetical protein [Candidatus Gracilibacteria bacterium]